MDYIAEEYVNNMIENPQNAEEWKKACTFQVGDICSMEYGIGMSLVKFYIVTRVSKSNVWLQRINETFTHDGHGQEGWKLPFPLSDLRSAEFKLKIHNDGSEEFLDMRHQGIINKWNGKPLYYNCMD